MLIWASEGAQSGEGLVFTRPSILFRPRQEQAGDSLLLVEPPGTAPGSEPLITRAFIAIVRRHAQYRGRGRAMKGAMAAAGINHRQTLWKGGQAAFSSAAPIIV